MLDLTNQDSETVENCGKNFEHSLDDQGVSTSVPPMESKISLEKQQRNLADLAVWLKGLNATELPLDDHISLCSGRAFAELLHEIDKNFFDQNWLETILEIRTTSNVVVKRSNIRKLWRKMSDYISLMNRKNHGPRWTEIDERVDNIDETDLPVAVDLAMTVVFIALIGKNQEKYVKYSKDFSNEREAVMKNVAEMIRMIMDELPETITMHEISDVHTSQNELNASQPQFSEYSNGSVEKRRTLSNTDQVLDEVQLELDHLRRENESLLKEVDRLTKALDSAQLDVSLDTNLNNICILERQNEEFRAKRRVAEEKVLELEACLEQFRHSIELLTTENDTLKTGQKEFQVLQVHFESAKSDLEEWKLKANQYQTDAEIAKSREKEVKELQGQVKSLMSRLEHHVKTATMDETNKSEIIELRKQVGISSAKLTELDIALKSKDRVVEQLEVQLIQYKEKVKELEDRKEDLLAERNDLEEKLHFKDSVTPRSLHESMFESGNLCFEPFSEKAKLPLDIENKRLAERIKELETLEPLKGEIIKIKNQNGALEEENLVISQQKEELQRAMLELQDILKKNQQHASGDVVQLKVQLEKAKVEIERMKEAETRAETRLADIEELLKKRTRELETNEMFLCKAKTVIDELENRCRPVGEDSITSVQAFKEMKEENERLRQRTEKLEEELNTVTQFFEQENRLLTSASHQQVLNRCSDDVMDIRAQAGHDEPLTLLETQKMSSALSWRSLASSVHRNVPTVTASVLLALLVWMFVNINSAVNAPPKA